MSKSKITVKELKENLDGNDLDISMRSLTEVPVKEISSVLRGTRLDLSCNQLTWITDDFCTLVHLVKIDLSQNHLQELPKEFGNLSNLEELDLYKNKLSDLPISFCRLKKLKWLDLKDNPLTEGLKETAGDCLDPKQCKQAAIRVVQYMSKIQLEKERVRQQKLAKEREEEKKQQELEEAAQREKAQQRKKEKERRKQEMKQKKAQMQNGVRNENGGPAEKVQNGVSKPLKKEEKKSSRFSIFGLLWFLFSVLMFSTLVAVCLTLVSALILYSNCSSRPEWIPHSQPLCKDMYAWTASGTPPNVKHLQAAMQGLGEVSAEKSKDLYNEVISIDYAHYASKASETMWKGVEAVKTADYKGFAENVVNKTSYGLQRLDKWSRNEAVPWLSKKAGEAKVGASWAFEESKVWTRWGLEKSMEGVKMGIEKTKDVVNNFPSYWEKLKYYWNNMK